MRIVQGLLRGRSVTPHSVTPVSHGNFSYVRRIRLCWQASRGLRFGCQIRLCRRCCASTSRSVGCQRGEKILGFKRMGFVIFELATGNYVAIRNRLPLVRTFDMKMLLVVPSCQGRTSVPDPTFWTKHRDLTELHPRLQRQCKHLQEHQSPAWISERCLACVSISMAFLHATNRHPRPLRRRRRKMR